MHTHSHTHLLAACLHKPKIPSRAINIQWFPSSQISSGLFRAQGEEGESRPSCFSFTRGLHRRHEEMSLTQREKASTRKFPQQNIGIFTACFSLSFLASNMLCILSNAVS